MFASIDYLYLHKYTINIRILKTVVLSHYKGSAFRGLFIDALKKTCCIKDFNKPCENDCRCLFTEIMHPTLPDNHPRKTKYLSAPPPYIIEPPENEDNIIQSGKLLSFNLTLIGIANEFLPVIIQTFIEMGRIEFGSAKGNFEIISISAVNQDNKLYPIFENNKFLGTKQTFTISKQNLKLDTHRINKIKFKLLTPLRVKEKGKLSDLSFTLILNRLEERAALLSSLYCNAPDNILDFKTDNTETNKITISDSELVWIDWERYSGRQKTTMKFGGYKGYICFSGELATYFPLLKLGEYTHIGANTTFGLGKYKINCELSEST